MLMIEKSELAVRTILHPGYPFAIILLCMLKQEDIAPESG